MVPTSRDGQSSPLVTASFDEGDVVSEVVLDAFLAAHVDVFEKDRTLHDRIDGDVLDGIDRESSRSTFLTFPIWGHRVVVRPGLVAIYETTDIGSIRGVNR